MQEYKQDFIHFILEVNALKFGEFTLKSGRVSPYFFNAGLFNTARHLAKLGEFYAQAIHEHIGEFNVLFGPAYKGIPLASSTAVALYKQYNAPISYSFNRKEAKDHGEGGMIVGSELKGEIVIIDDVITAGTAINESMNMMAEYDCTVKSVIVALDRKEKGKGDTSAIQDIKANYGIDVVSIISLDDIIEYIKQRGDNEILEKVVAYRDEYGV